MKTRKSLRLRNYDYTYQRIYFVTFCSDNKIEIFSEIINEKVVLMRLGSFIDSELKKLEKLLDFRLLTYSIMPNHIHLLIDKENDLDLVRIVKSIKYNTSFYAKHEMNLPMKLWQRSFYDRVVRNERELKNIYNYIENNHLKWSLDIENPSKSSDYFKYYEGLFEDS